MNRLGESDRTFLAQHNFDADVPFSDHPDTWVDDAKFLGDSLNNFLVSISGLSYTLDEMIKVTRVGRTAALRFVRSHPELTSPALMRTDGYVERWTSHAPVPSPSPEGLVEDARLEQEARDELGRQARADFWWTTRRGQKKRKQHSHAVRHF